MPLHYSYALAKPERFPGIPKYRDKAGSFRHADRYIFYLSGIFHTRYTAETGNPAGAHALSRFSVFWRH